METRERIFTLTLTQTSTICGCHNNVSIFCDNVSWLLLLNSSLKCHQRTSWLDDLHTSGSPPLLWDTLCLLSVLTVTQLFTICQPYSRSRFSVSYTFPLIFLNNTKITACPVRTDIPFYLKRSRISKVILSFKRTSPLPNNYNWSCKVHPAAEIGASDLW